MFTKPKSFHYQFFPSLITFPSHTTCHIIHFIHLFETLLRLGPCGFFLTAGGLVNLSVPYQWTFLEAFWGALLCISPSFINCEHLFINFTTSLFWNFLCEPLEVNFRYHAPSLLNDLVYIFKESSQSLTYNRTFFKIRKFNIIKFHALMYTPYYKSA